MNHESRCPQLGTSDTWIWVILHYGAALDTEHQQQRHGLLLPGTRSTQSCSSQKGTRALPGAPLGKEGRHQVKKYKNEKQIPNWGTQEEQKWQQRDQKFLLTFYKGRKLDPLDWGSDRVDAAFIRTDTLTRDLEALLAVVRMRFLMVAQPLGNSEIF